MQHAVLLLVIAQALRAGEHGVVIGHGDNARLFVVELVAVNAAEPHHQPVAGRLLDQVLHGAAAQLPGDDQAGIFGEGTRIAQILDVLACGALPRLAPLGHGIRPGCILGEAFARIEFGEVRADGVKIDRFGFGRRRAADLGFLDEGERGVLEYRVAWCHGQPAHDAAEMGGNHMLHLHRFHDDKGLAFMHCVARLRRQSKRSCPEAARAGRWCPPALRPRFHPQTRSPNGRDRARPGGRRR